VRLFFQQDFTPPEWRRHGDHPRHAAAYETGKWYDNVPAAHATAALQLGLAEPLIMEDCRCLVLAGGRVVRYAPPCARHGGS
jgi:hypothetical protein